MMEMRLLRKRRRRGWSSSILHGVVIVTTITTTITFWNVVHDVNRMAIPIITATTGIIDAMISMVNVNGYSSATKHQRPVTRSSMRPPSTGGDTWFTNRHTTASSSSLRDHRLGDDTAPTNNINNNNNKEDQTYSLMTWNLLAPVYASHEKYSYCSKIDLNWNQTRCPKILQTIASTNADIVCLQEVQIDTWYSNLLPYFQNECNHEYTCLLQNVTRNHPIACATLIKSSKFHIHTIESRSRALIVVVYEKQPTPPSIVSSSLSHPPLPPPPLDARSFLYIANVHLDARYDQDTTRYNQIKSLLHRIEYHYDNHPTNRSTNPVQTRRRQLLHDAVFPNNNTCTTPESTTIKATASYNNNPQHALISISSPVSVSPRIIIAGDFNMLRTNPIYTLLSTGKYNIYLQPNQKFTTISKMNARDRNPLPIQPLPYLPLQDVYNNKQYAALDTNSTVPVPHILRRTFAGGSILDYIWCSAERVQAVPWMIDSICYSSSGSSTLASTGTATNRNKNQALQKFRWPSKDQPSDHVPIGIRFFIK